MLRRVPQVGVLASLFHTSFCDISRISRKPAKIAFLAKISRLGNRLKTRGPETCVVQRGVLADLCFSDVPRAQVSEYRDLWHPPGRGFTKKSFFQLPQPKPKGRKLLLDFIEAGLAEILATEQFGLGAAGQLTDAVDIQPLQRLAAADGQL